MGLLTNLRRSKYVSSIDPTNDCALSALQRQMRTFYIANPYHERWIKGYNSRWTVGNHDAQIEMCRHVPEGARILEVGCGDGSAEQELRTNTRMASYVGVDIKPELWAGKQQFVAADAGHLPLATRCVDIVIAMFALEHLVYPRRFLDEAWRVLDQTGRLLLISPDFSRNAMASEWIGTSYGSGRDKLTRGRLADAFLTAFDSRIRLSMRRAARNRSIARGNVAFPVLLHPRCLYSEGFVPDCDAVYPSSPEEVAQYLGTKPGYVRATVFYRRAATFGLAVFKASCLMSQS
jgi:SAM-dependent methyltransferase